MSSDVIYENTYQLDPGSNKLTSMMIRPWLKRAMTENLSSYIYDPKTAAVTARDVCAKVQNYILQSLSESAGFTEMRYKIAVQTFIIPLKEQGIRLATRCLWNPDTDNLVAESVQPTNSDSEPYIATSLVFFTYTE